LAARGYRVLGLVGVSAVLAAVVSLLLGPYWLVDNFILAFAALYIISYCLRKSEPSLWPEMRRPVVRSRVEHYTQVIRAGESAAVKKYASNPFESAVLSLSDFRSLDDQTLRRLVAARSAEIEASQRENSDPQAGRRGPEKSLTSP
jgi:hypothetical protein